MTLAEIRQQQGLSRNELSRRSGVAPMTIAFIERGIIRKPKWETIMRLCATLGVLPEDVDEFAGLVKNESWIFTVWELWAKNRAERQQATGQGGQ